MEANGMSCVTLGLELPQQQQQQQHIFPPHSLSSYTSQHHAHQSTNHNAYPYPTKPKQQQLSDEDEAQPQVQSQSQSQSQSQPQAQGGDKRMSQWQRMKWTDGMVRLLIMVVFYIGDDCNNVESNAPVVKRKLGPGAGGGSGSGVLQKKGKWKSVSRAMMEKGFYVSPQQCEDKFNDLNKRYKRVNDILGKGTACRVVENHTLLDSMDHLSPRMKEEVRKLLNSKHLFFKEMCAYHNSGSGGCNASTLQDYSSHNQQQHSFQSPENGADSKTEGLNKTKTGARQIEEDDDEEYNNDADDETGASGGCGSRDKNGEEMGSRSKRQRRDMFTSMQQISCELMSVLQDGTKSPREQQLWMMSRTLQLEEQRVRYQCQAFELEKQRLKWIKFSAKKERDMERMKLSNERMRLENERMLLLLRNKELEIIQQQQQSSNPKSTAG